MFSQDGVFAEYWKELFGVGGLKGWAICLVLGVVQACKCRVYMSIFLSSTLGGVT